VTDKILAIVFPISAFVATGFEHSVANMYFISIGLFVKHDHTWVASLGSNAPDTSSITWTNFLWGNLVPVTLGNIVGGALMVGAVYWFIYLRPAGGRSAGLSPKHGP
jgi:formate/nitrite transporter FocA (FNT family)